MKAPGHRNCIFSAAGAKENQWCEALSLQIPLELPFGEIRPFNDFVYVIMFFVETVVPLHEKLNKRFQSHCLEYKIASEIDFYHDTS